MAFVNIFVCFITACVLTVGGECNEYGLNKYPTWRFLLKTLPTCVSLFAMVFTAGV